jgi:hypothetical protein
METPLTKIGKIPTVKLKNALGKIDNRFGAMENPLSINGKSPR